MEVYILLNGENSTMPTGTVKVIEIWKTQLDKTQFDMEDMEKKLLNLNNIRIQWKVLPPGGTIKLLEGLQNFGGEA